LVVNQSIKGELIMAITQQVYSLTDLFESINDIHFQHDEGKMNAQQAYSLARMCCSEFLNHSFDSNAPLFLCQWNDGEIIQLHTKESLYEQYKDTNLFDEDEEKQDLEGNTLAVGVLEWMEALSYVNFTWQTHESFTFDNFTMRRIR
jgi:hypothetical protein